VPRSTPGADAVVGVPDSGLPAAVGYARGVGLPLRLGLAKNRYVGRTFIRPGVAARAEAASRKLGVVAEAVAGRRVVLVDDSLVRGTTARRLVGLLREAGAREVHLRIAAPPYRHPCPYGIAVPSRSELPLAAREPEAQGRVLEADSLAFLSVEGLGRALGGGLCTACFSGRYPVPSAATGDAVGVGGA
jgi:amidophosphoribosyltransferase